MKTQKELESELARIMHPVTIAANKYRLAQAALSSEQWREQPLRAAVQEKAKAEYDKAVSKAVGAWRQTIEAHADDYEFTRGWRLRSLAAADNKALKDVSPVMASVFKAELASMTGDEATFVYQQGQPWQKAILRHCWKPKDGDAASHELAEVIAEGPTDVIVPDGTLLDPKRASKRTLPTRADMREAAATGKWAVDQTKTLDPVAYTSELSGRFGIKGAGRPTFSQHELALESRRLDRVADALADEAELVNPAAE